MKRSLINCLTVAVLTLAAPAQALAAGANYFPPAPAIPTQTPAAAATSQSTATTTCTTPATPDMTVYSPSGYTVTETSPGDWTLAFTNFDQNSGDWVVSWSNSSGATGYDFEVSDSSSVDPATGQFVSPIAADHVSGNQTTSKTMQIGPEEVYYFHVKAIGSGSCTGAYSPVEQIDTTVNEPALLARHNDNGTKGLELLTLTALLAAAYGMLNRSSGRPLSSYLRSVPGLSR